MMADDDRRAEIEAAMVAAMEFIGGLVHLEHVSAADGAVNAVGKDAREFLATVGDRVRDARDDDEGPTITEGEFWTGFRSPQDEGHDPDERALDTPLGARQRAQTQRDIADILQFGSHSIVSVTPETNDEAARSPQGEVGIPKVALDAAEQAVHACRHYALGHPSRRALYVDARDEAYDVLAAALPYLAARSPQSNDEGHTKGCIQGEIDSECPCEARSPQGEDHEAGDSVFAHLDRAFLEDLYARALHRITQLEDVSPALVVAELYVRENRVRGRDAVQDHALVRAALAKSEGETAEFSHSSAARPEQPPPDSLGGQPPAEPPEAP